MELHHRTHVAKIGNYFCASPKFDEEYHIYGDDITVRVPQQWKTFDHVIVSIDRAKSPNHMDMIRRPVAGMS